MSTFGIRMSEFAGSDEHFVNEDDVLFDWLLANNYGPSDEDSMFIVPAPAGYVFWKGKVIADNSPKLENVDASEISKSATVTSGSSENDKAIMLLEEAMSYVKRKAFYEIGISEDRILDYVIY
jgi:hypothetical protein